MPTLIDIISESQPVDAHHPWPRAVVESGVWRFATGQLANGHWSLLALWGEATVVHMALFDKDVEKIGVISLDCPDNIFPSVGLWHPPAIRPERAILDLFGLQAEEAADTRPWLDHGQWNLRHPLGSKVKVPAEKIFYEFLTAEGESLHQIPVGPVHAGIIEPGHFRFTAAGETVVRLEERLGYTHKGIEGLMTGASLDRAAKLAGRASGDSTLAYAIAFAQAAEAALGVEVPQRAIWLRALMAEVERLANHLGDIGGICNDAAFALMHAHCGILRELVLRAADGAFGHRLMMDRVIPGGLATDIAKNGADLLRALTKEIRTRFPALVTLYDNTPSLQDRTVGAGILTPALARQFAAGGYAGRASGRTFDARRMPGYAPYAELAFDVPVREEGDVDARVWIRILEIEQSLSMVEQILDRLPGGPVYTAPNTEKLSITQEGMALVEGFRGDILAWVRIGEDGKVTRCHLRDPSWFQWPLIEAAIEGNIVADFPLCNKSFNCSYSGHDL